MTDVWEYEEPYTITEKELFRLAYELFCEILVGEALQKAKKEFGKDVDKVIAYVKLKCG